MQYEQLFLVVHVLIAFAIVGLILLQQGKGAEMGASFGAGSSQTVFGGAGGGNLLTRATAVLAAAFFATSFALAVVAKNQAASVGAIDLGVPVVERSGALDDEVVPVSPVVDSDVPEIPGAGSASPAEIPEID